MLWGSRLDETPRQLMYHQIQVTGRVTGVVREQSVLVDGIPHHVCDLHPTLELGHSATDESDESSGDKLLIN